MKRLWLFGLVMALALTSCSLLLSNAEAAGLVCNVQQYGAKGDGKTDDAVAIQKAVTDCEKSSDSTVYLPAGTYLVGQSIRVQGSRITIKGSDAKKSTLRDHPKLGAKPIMQIGGSEVQRSRGIVVTHLGIRNGNASAENANGSKNGIEVAHIVGFTLQYAFVHEIEGHYGVVGRFVQRLEVIETEFRRWTHAGLFLMPECEDVRIAGNLFDTATSQTMPNTYTFGTGADGTMQGLFFVRNLIVENNTFQNNPRWEGIDCHGGENILIRNNRIRNVRMGIMVGLSVNSSSGDPYVLFPVLRNVLIEGNEIEKGNDSPAFSRGLIVHGGETEGFIGRNVRVSANKIRGFNLADAFWFDNIDGLVAENNQISR